MNVPSTTVVQRFDSNNICVSLFQRVAPSNTPGLPFEAKNNEYRNSVLTGKEIPLKQFLSLGFSYLSELQQIWATDDKKTRNSLKRDNLPAATISATLLTRDSHKDIKEKIKHYNSLIVLDFDNVEDLIISKKKVEALPYVWYVGQIKHLRHSCYQALNFTFAHWKKRWQTLA